MTEKELVELVLSNKNVVNKRYKKDVYDIVNYIEDKKDCRILVSYFKDDIIDTIRVFKDIYFYFELREALEKWVKKVFHLEQFYFTGNVVWVQTTKKQSLLYYTNMVALDISLKEKKLIIHEVDIFSESKKTVIESPVFVTDDDLRLVERETENLIMFEKEHRGLMAHKKQENTSLFFRNVRQVKTTDKRQVSIILTDGTVEKIPY